MADIQCRNDHNVLVTHASGGQEPQCITPDLGPSKKQRQEEFGIGRFEDGKPVARNLTAEFDSVGSDRVITGDTVMGFSSHPTLSNREIVLQEPAFVRWAKTRGEAYGKLEAFVKWLETDEAKYLMECESKGHNQVTFGNHRGKNFLEMLRYEKWCDQIGNSPRIETLTGNNASFSASEDREPAVSRNLMGEFISSLAPNPSNNSDDLDGVTGDTVMGFPKHPTFSNLEIVLHEPGFVEWAKKQAHAYGRLASFRKWLETDEAKSLKYDEAGNEMFTFGQHKGQKFWEIAKLDPQYHIRYRCMLKKNGGRAYGAFVRYEQWFKDRPKHCQSNTQRNTGPTRNEGNTRFKSGRYKGITFMEVATNDPSYHLRCKHTGYDRKDDTINEYVAWFNRFSPTRLRARQHHKEDIAYRLGSQSTNSPCP